MTRFCQLHDLLGPEVGSRLAGWARTAIQRLGADPSWYPTGGSTAHDVLAIDEDLRGEVAAAIAGLVPLVRRELGLPRFPLGSIDIVASVEYADGTVLGAEAERSAGERSIDFVYHLDEPASDGATLLLLDAHSDAGAPSFVEVPAVANSIVFFASSTHHETTRPSDGATRVVLRGWVNAEAPQIEPNDELERIGRITELHCRHLPRLSAGGFEIRPMPTAVHQLLRSLLELRGDRRQAEEADRNYHWGTDNDLIDVTDMTAEVLAALQPLHERFAGTALVPTALYGLREYREGSQLAMHVDRIETHIVSSVLQVAQDVDEPWPLQLDVDGTVHDIFLEPGQLLLYEGASTKHGRMRPLRGRSYVNAFAHYRPVDWDWTESVLLERAAVV